MDQPVCPAEALPAAAPPVACSRLTLRRMLGNLVDNAIRYGDRADVRASLTADVLGIEVRDHGPGIPAEALARVTEPFERLDVSQARDTGGAGLGLAIVKALAQSVGGALILANAKGGGLSATPRLHFG